MASPDPAALPLPMYPLPSAAPPPHPHRTKRRQVKNACTNCQKACKKCDDARPCLRCVKYGMQEACVSSQRKERKKGVKRGPYKKRESKDHSSNATNPPDSSNQQECHLAQPIPSASSASPVIPSYIPIGLPTAFYAPHQPSKNGETPSLYHPYFLTQLQPPTLPPPHNAQDGVSPNHPPSGSYYSAALVAQFSPTIYPQYHIPRPDVQTLPQNIHYTLYGPSTCTKQPSDHDGNDIDHGGSPHRSG